MLKRQDEVNEEYIKSSLDKYEAKMLRGSKQREQFMNQLIGRSQMLNEKSESKIFAKQSNQSLEREIRHQH